ncbi:MAG: RNA-binding protein [Clostridiales bacterium]|nr:RNA-binding protein [Clostridiales bacterium]
MKHYMNLKNGPFTSIKNGTKIYELRLFDEKRQLLKVNDYIEFTNRSTNEKLNVKIKNLHKFDNFEQLYNKFDKISLGYEPNQVANAKDMEEYYSKEEQSKYGVVAIEITKI